MKQKRKLRTLTVVYPFYNQERLFRCTVTFPANIARYKIKEMFDRLVIGNKQDILTVDLASKFTQLDPEIHVNVEKV